MALTLTNANLTLTTSQTQVYVVPAGRTAVITMIQAANKTNLSDTVTVHWVNSANSQVTNLVFNAPVPSKGAISCITGKLTLKAGDIIRALCTTHQAIDLTIGIMEIS